ncbi:MAG: DNA mismatch repair endonuclease MutL, partial [Lachnospiraceae bacterium]|nr:DNA mismatch repair endonuclease MutL [Lachnospiraceae bacterium]
EIAASVIPIQAQKDGISVEGYLGKPVIVRSNRNFEIYYINGRFIKSPVVAKAIEEGYKEYLMQHKFPMCVLHIAMDREKVDVNVHPTKMDVRFSDVAWFMTTVSEIIKTALKSHEMLPDNILTSDKERAKEENEFKRSRELERIPEIFEHNRSKAYRVREESMYMSEMPKKQDFLQKPVWSRVLGGEDDEKNEDLTNEPSFFEKKNVSEEKNSEEANFFVEASEPWKDEADNAPQTQNDAAVPDTTEQMTLFEERLITASNRSGYNIIGQVFDTYWLVQFEDKLFIIDQHAAHEKVKYERFMKRFREKEILSQALMPPIVVTLTAQEENVFRQYQDVFSSLGFEVESFGGSEYTLRSVPVDLYGCSEKELFLSVLDELCEMPGRGSFKVIEEKIASMSCKAAVKGNNRLSIQEAGKLIDELLTLDNPYNCPHGRPTIIVMSKTEMEKKFKRIV